MTSRPTIASRATRTPELQRSTLAFRFGNAFLHDLAEEFERRFKIRRPTVQIEVDPHLACALASEDAV